MSCTTLLPILRQEVDFDPKDPEHLKAFKMLVIGDENGVIRQHERLRFNPEPFKDVRVMMIHKVCESVAKEV